MQDKAVKSGSDNIDVSRLPECANCPYRADAPLNQGLIDAAISAVNNNKAIKCLSHDRDCKGAEAFVKLIDGYMKDSNRLVDKKFEDEPEEVTALRAQTPLMWEILIPVCGPDGQMYTSEVHQSWLRTVRKAYSEHAAYVPMFLADYENFVIAATSGKGLSKEIFANSVMPVRISATASDMAAISYMVSRTFGVKSVVFYPLSEVSFVIGEKEAKEIEHKYGRHNRTE